jgi:hypothetical protein
VAECRAFTVGAAGHFVGFEPIVCDTDDQAIERAKRLIKRHGVGGGRLVARLNAGEGNGAVTHEIKDGWLKPKT